MMLAVIIPDGGEKLRRKYFLVSQGDCLINLFARSIGHDLLIVVVLSK